MDDRFQNLSSIPIPFLALARMHSLFSITSSSSISPITRSGSAAGRSILSITGNDRQVVLEAEVIVRERLRFDALRRVDDQ